MRSNEREDASDGGASDCTKPKKGRVMKRVERETIERIIEEASHIMIPARCYELDEQGKLTPAETYRTPEEVKRLFASEDFKLGWQLCYERMREQLMYVLSSPPEKELKKYMRYM